MQAGQAQLDTRSTRGRLIVDRSQISLHPVEWASRMLSLQNGVWVDLCRRDRWRMRAGLQSWQIFAVQLIPDAAIHPTIACDKLDACDGNLFRTTRSRMTRVDMRWEGPGAGGTDQGCAVPKVFRLLSGYSLSVSGGWIWIGTVER